VDTTTILVAANLDRDTARVRYAGHDFGFTDPIVIAVLASPPYWAEVAQADAAYAGAYPNWQTSFGQATSQSSSASVSAGFSIGITIECEQEFAVFGIKAAQFKASASFKTNVDWNLSSSYEIAQEVQYYAIGGEDKVIFTAAPIDVYSYEILDSPDGSEVGRTMTIQVPRAFSIYKTTKELFNASNGAAFDIDSTVLKHTKGLPRSYRTPSEKNSLIAAYGGYQTSAETVGQAPDGQPTGPTWREIAATSTTAMDLSLEEEIEASVGGGAAGVSVLLDAGFRAGVSFGTSTSASTIFGGTFGYLPARFYAQASYLYKAGLFAIPYFDERDNRLFWIVDYWVE